jgi:2,4-dienoyl-CoA reductase (NADPH2)
MMVWKSWAAKVILINQFLVSHTNQRNDEWGGSFENRMRFPLEIVKGIRERVGKNFIIIYRLSMLDLIKDGQTTEEIITLGKAIERAGASLINTGIGWHEARIPTIAQMVPRGAFTWVTKRIKQELTIPVITTNRINMPDVAEKILRHGDADMVSMARPFLADPDLVAKAAEGKSNEINTCIACNQACLDHIFNQKVASCLVNPFACRESELEIKPTVSKKKIAVVGAGPAGLAAALVLAQRGHFVSLYEKGDAIGGQLRLASNVSGKEEFRETLRYYQTMLNKLHVDMQLSTSFDFEKVSLFDEVVYAAGVLPRSVDIPGSNLPHVVPYDQLLNGQVIPGNQIVIIGAGGIGIDTAMFLLKGSAPVCEEEFCRTWKIDQNMLQRGGILPGKEKISSHRSITILQRGKGRAGKNLGKTTAWIHREEMKIHGIKFMDDLKYVRITESHIEIEREGKLISIEADQIVVCAGQVSNTDLLDQIKSANQSVHVIGGALFAGELDAKRAIEEGTRLALTL